LGFGRAPGICAGGIEKGSPELEEGAGLGKIGFWFIEGGTGADAITGFPAGAFVAGMFGMGAICAWFGALSGLLEIGTSLGVLTSSCAVMLDKILCVIAKPWLDNSQLN